MNGMRLLTAALGLLAALLLGGCGDGSGPFGGERLTVLAGSELEDVEPLLDEIRERSGVELEFHYIGTLDGAERIIAGADYDLAWFSHAKYLSLLQGERRRIQAQEKIMLSPVVLGIKEGLARRWGWYDNSRVTWSEIADKAAAGELRYAMTNPASSNSGFTATLAMAAAFAGKGDALRAEEVDAERLAAVAKGQALTAGSSHWLADAYVAEQERLDGLINYESVLMQLNKGGRLREPLHLIYPADGIVTADYPLMLLNPERREAYGRLVAALRSPEVQTLLMERTDRRPAVPQVRPDGRFPERLLVEIPFPNRAEVVDQILFAYLDRYRRPSHSLFVLDVSGSMAGVRLAALQQAVRNLTGLDRSVAGRFARFRSRERITLIPFDSRVRDTDRFEIGDPDAESEAMRNIRARVDGLAAGGNTAIYDALAHAYRLAGEARAADPERFYSIVLMSDGENAVGMDLGDFRRWYAALPEEVRAVRTFPIVFGDANEGQMRELARLTGGRHFDGRSGDLGQVFKKIRGYQ